MLPKATQESHIILEDQHLVQFPVTWSGLKSQSAASELKAIAVCVLTESVRDTSDCTRSIANHRSCKDRSNPFGTKES